MDSLKPPLPKINYEDRTPIVDVLLELAAWQDIKIDKLEQEILKLKGETTKPKIKPSKMDDDPAKDEDENGDGDGSDKKKKRKGPKRSKTKDLKIDAIIDCHPDNIPEPTFRTPYLQYCIIFIAIFFNKLMFFSILCLLLCFHISA